MWLLPEALQIAWRKWRSSGQQGERAAARYLRRQGCRILARNLHSAKAEIDILALTPDGRTLIIGEVKTTHRPGVTPALRVDGAKQRLLNQAAVQVARRYKLQDRPIRFDVLAVVRDAQGQWQVTHIPGAFESRW